MRLPSCPQGQLSPYALSSADALLGTSQGHSAKLLKYYASVDEYSMAHAQDIRRLDHIRESAVSAGASSQTDG